MTVGRCLIINRAQQIEPVDDPLWPKVELAEQLASQVSFGIRLRAKSLDSEAYGFSDANCIGNPKPASSRSTQRRLPLRAPGSDWMPYFLLTGHFPPINGRAATHTRA